MISMRSIFFDMKKCTDFFWREKETERLRNLESYTNEMTLKNVARFDGVNFLI